MQIKQEGISSCSFIRPSSQTPQETDSDREIWVQEAYWGVSEGRIGKREKSHFDTMAAEASACPTGSSGAKMAAQS